MISGFSRSAGSAVTASMNKKTVAIIGAGRVGGSVGCLLSRAGYTLTAVAARSLASAEKARTFIGSGDPTLDAREAASKAAIVFITTPDDVIKQVCDAIASRGGLRKGAVVVHMSGAHSLDLLDSARAAGAYRAVIHPLQSVPSMEQGVVNIPDSYFRVEADTEAAEEAHALVTALGGKELSMPGWMPGRGSTSLYHAGAVSVSNYLVALVDFGLKFYEALGADRREALCAIMPLIEGTIKNIKSLGVPEALTGPIARGDAETVRAHLEAMQDSVPELLPLYKALARHTITVAEARGLKREKAAEMLKIIQGAGSE